MSELLYLQYAATNQADVALPVLSLEDKLVETIPDEEDGYFSVVCFEKAPGQHPRDENHQSDLYYAWGKAMGRLHRLSTTYQPAEGYQRMHWYEEVEITQPDQFLSPDQWLIIEKIQQATARLKTLPVSQETYGVIHNDLHTGNFLLNGRRITMIDFEDAVQMWYVSDIAISLFMTAVWPPNNQPREEVPFTFLPPFLKGYRSEKEISSQCLYRMPLFLKFRELGQYVAMYRGADLENMHPWVARFMEGRRERIENEIPVFEVKDWEQFL
jgi:Ser/Thr protein kinase RdoA (MazF antagonist)